MRDETPSLDERILELGDGSQVSVSDARHIDVRGRTLMPGLIDCHVHALAASADLFIEAEWSPMYLAAHARHILEGMLRRGFTTVRDAAGADFGLAMAVEEGLFAGPRLIFGGRALSQTGGHADGRSRGRTALEYGYSYSSIGVVVDGVAEVRKAVREEIKRGASHIKLMLSGGCPFGSAHQSLPFSSVRRFSTRAITASTSSGRDSPRWLCSMAG